MIVEIEQDSDLQNLIISGKTKKHILVSVSEHALMTEKMSDIKAKMRQEFELALAEMENKFTKLINALGGIKDAQIIQ